MKSLTADDFYSELISMRNMGGKSISVIEEKLSEKGITLPV